MIQVAKLTWLSVCCIAVFTAVTTLGHAQGRQQDAATIVSRNATEKELEAIAVIERKVMVAMRDGKRLQADIYRPKDETKKYPVIFVRTPYNFNRSSGFLVGRWVDEVKAGEHQVEGPVLRIPIPS